MNGSQLKRLHEALLSAFPNRASLEQMISFGLSEPLVNVVADGTHAYIVYQLIGWAEAQGRLDELVQNAHETVPGNPLLSAYVRDFPDDFAPLLLSKRVRQSPQNQDAERVRKAFEVAVAVLPMTFPLHPELKEFSERDVYACLRRLSGLANPEELAGRVGAFLLALDFDWRRAGSNEQRWFEEYLEFYGGKERIDAAKTLMSNSETMQYQMQQKRKQGDIPVLAVMVDAVAPSNNALREGKSTVSAKLYRRLPISSHDSERPEWLLLRQYSDTDPTDYLVGNVNLTAFGGQEAVNDPQAEFSELSGLRRWLKSALWEAVYDLTIQRASVQSEDPPEVGSDVRIEFFLQEHLMDVPVDTWKIFDPALSAKRLASYHERGRAVPQVPIGQKYYVVIRSRDRLEQEIADKEEQHFPGDKRKRLQTFEHYLFEGVPNAESFYNTMARADNTKKAIFICGKTVYRHDPEFWGAVSRSYIPFGIWARDRKQGEPQLVGNDLSGLYIPAVATPLELAHRVWSLRTKIIAEPTPALEAGISLLFDYYENTSCLPPVDMAELGDTVG